MNEKRYQEMVFTIEDYATNGSKDEARTEMWKDISTFLQILTKNEYIAVIYDDDTDIIVIQYEHNENCDAWGCANPEWITEAEKFKLESTEESFTYYAEE